MGNKAKTSGKDKDKKFNVLLKQTSPTDRVH